MANDRSHERKSQGNRIAILQSCYLPWRGYFDLIGLVDVFVVYDDVQYSKNHWHNRNRIRTNNGVPWITIPVSLPFGLRTKIEEVRIAKRFAKKHWQAIVQSYASAAFFEKYERYFELLFFRVDDIEFLSDVNLLFLKEISALLGLKTKFVLSRDLGVKGAQSERLLSICQTLHADRYLSGPAAKAYLKTAIFQEAGISVEWIDYSRYKPYNQVWPGFEPAVSIVDLIFNVGPSAIGFMKSSEKNS